MFIRLIHWKPEVAEERAERLCQSGYQVQAGPLEDPRELRAMRSDPPAAVVIDLERLPSHGRDVGLALRESKATRRVPLVFVGGATEKVARVRAALPDATYTTWSRIRGSLKRAIAHPPAEPLVPQTRMDGYSGTPLPKKLGIKPGSTVILLQAPDDLDQTLGELPDGVTLRRQLRGRRDLILWFVRNVREFERRIDQLASGLGKGGLWIAWPKKASGVQTDINGNHIRKVALAAGLVDYKVCSIDSTWSGLKFSVCK